MDRVARILEGAVDLHVHPAPSPLPRRLDAAEAALVHRALGLIREEFEPRTWEAFWQTAVEGRTAAEAGADLDMTPGAVRVAKSRVLHRLRTELGDRDARD